MFARERETSRAKLAFFLAITCVCWSAADMLGIIHHFVLVDFKYLPERDRWRGGILSASSLGILSISSLSGVGMLS
jgi:hypothetical protein